jgi:hypothetical protein
MAPRNSKTARNLERAQRSLEQARRQATEQDRKRAQEQESLIRRMERLAESNHLAALIGDVVAGSGGP